MSDTSDGYTCGGPDASGGSYEGSGENLMGYWYDTGGSGGGSSSARSSGGSLSSKTSSREDDSDKAGQSVLTLTNWLFIIFILLPIFLLFPAVLLASMWQEAYLTSEHAFSQAFWVIYLGEIAVVAFVLIAYKVVQAITSIMNRFKKQFMHH